jgi:hypothetical protein
MAGSLERHRACGQFLPIQALDHRIGNQVDILIMFGAGFEDGVNDGSEDPFHCCFPAFRVFENFYSYNFFGGDTLFHIHVGEGLASGQGRGCTVGLPDQRLENGRSPRSLKEELFEQFPKNGWLFFPAHD